MSKFVVRALRAASVIGGIFLLGCSASDGGATVDRQPVRPDPNNPSVTPPLTPVNPGSATPGGSDGTGFVNDLAPGPTNNSPSTGPCTAVVCAPPGGQYCGTIGDGCNGRIDCGTCPNDFLCEQGLCVGGPNCARRSQCSEGTAQYCGAIGDGCGGTLECGGCGDGLTCRGGMCVQQNCTPATCSSGGTRFCGQIGDGCGGTLDCGTCADNAVCGGGGVANVCAGGDNCTAVGCQAEGGALYCGTIGDGCGGISECGACPAGINCNAGVCPGTGNACNGLQCQVDECMPGVQTTLSGTVFAPNGTLPLYGALVYVPNGPLDPIRDGAECSPCSAGEASGQPIATALTDTFGRFELRGVPTGTNIPLVIQVGKWRRQITIPNVGSCAINPANPALTRLPRTQAEGNIPRIGITTGDADALECLIRRLGVADSEFTTNAGNGRIHLYAGGDPDEDDDDTGVGATNFVNGTAFPQAATLWGNPALLRSYDILMFSCEGGQFEDAKEPYRPNIFNYAQGGGRLFLSHLHFNWLSDGPDEFQETADYIGVGDDLTEEDESIRAFVDTTFPRGADLADWLVNVGASPARGQFDLYQGQHSVAAVVPPTQRWIYVPQNPNDEDLRPSIQYMTFNTPVGGAPNAPACGRVVLTDLHLNTATPLGGGDSSQPDDPFPSGCANTPFTAQALAMAYMFYDLSACVSPDSGVNVPPPPVQPQNPVPPAAIPAPPAPPPPPPPPPILR